MNIRGIEGISPDQLRFEIQRGARLVCYSYCISLILVTFRRSSDIYYIPAGESALAKGLPWTALTALLGWWGIPWGPIYSVQSLVVNLKGGKDLTTEFLSRLTPNSSGPVVSPVGSGVK
jgi:hypothetical protein